MLLFCNVGAWNTNEYRKFDCDKLNGPIKVLSYYVAIFYLEKADDVRCEILADKILPLIEKIYPDLHQQWLEEKEEHINESKSLYEKALADIKNVFSVLRQRIVSAGLLANEKIKQSVCVADARLEFRPASENAFMKNADVTGKSGNGFVLIVGSIKRVIEYMHCRHMLIAYMR